MKPDNPVVSDEEVRKLVAPFIEVDSDGTLIDADLKAIVRAGVKRGLDIGRHSLGGMFYEAHGNSTLRRDEDGWNQGIVAAQKRLALIAERVGKEGRS